MHLTPRLQLAAQLASDARHTIDVGCDHGYLSIAMMEQGGIHGFASDIRWGPLQALRKNIRRYHLEQKITPVLCPGLAVFGPKDGDTICICGMGGEMIAQILAQAPWTRTASCRLILQPMTNGPYLRRFLWEQGYGVDRECLAREGRHLYCVLSVRGGRAQPKMPDHWLFTAAMERDARFIEYVRWQIVRYEKILRGKEMAQQTVEEEEKILAILKEYTHAIR